MLKNILCLLLILSLTNLTNGFAQEPTQTVRGVVLDKASHKPIESASVYLENISPTIGTTTDSSGKFRIKNVPVGRYTLAVQHISYKPYVIPNLEVNAGKEVILDITLVERLKNIKEVEVTAKPAHQTFDELHPVSSRIITVEQANRFAATYLDPARLVTSYPGINTYNDQANHISVRGNSPNGISWYLEGAEIVNPNHTANAGTSTDRITVNGGGTIIFSAQLLDDCLFMSGAFPAEYGNALSGIFDVGFREGNNEKREYTAQVGVIGLDFAAEGPLSSSKNSSYLVNYRYSTVGLLSLMGIPLGDEDITYQDLSFNLAFHTKKAGKFTIFGIGGLSRNIFKAKRDSSSWEFQKDRYDINFYSKMGALGATHTYNISKKSYIKTVAAVSAVQHKREGIFLTNDYQKHLLEYDEYFKSTTSVNTSFNHKFNAKNFLRAGFKANMYGYRLNSEDRPINAPTDTLIDGSGSTQLLQPFIHWRHLLAQKLTLNAGLHYSYLTLNESAMAEPRASLKWDFLPNHSLSLAYGLHCQMQLLGTYFSSFKNTDGEQVYPNKNLDFTKAHHYVLNYTGKLYKKLTLEMELYYQDLFDVPISTNKNSSFSTINLMEGYVTDTLVNKGTGKNYGIEMTLQRALNKGYYFLLSSTLYQSKYTAADGIERNTRFNGNYNFTLTAGKEFESKKPEKNRVIGLNLRTIYQGGLRRTPIDAEASKAAGKTVFINDKAFSEQNQDYFRIDLRFSIKKNKPNYTRIFAIDIQNLTNQQNVAFQYYDTQKGEIVQKYQLGIIPLISYRVEF